MCLWWVCLWWVWEWNVGGGKRVGDLDKGWEEFFDVGGGEGLFDGNG